MQESIKVKSGSSSLLKIYSSLQQTQWSNETNKKINKETTFKFDAVNSGDSSYSPNVLGRPTTKHTEKVVQKHTTKFKHLASTDPCGSVIRKWIPRLPAHVTGYCTQLRNWNSARCLNRGGHDWSVEDKGKYFLCLTWSLPHFKSPVMLILGKETILKLAYAPVMVMRL